MANPSDSLDMQTVAVWLTQAAGFAKRDNFYEAAARMRFAAGQVDAALTGAASPAEKSQWQALAGQIERLLRSYTEQHEAWNAKIANGRQARTDAAAEEMARPLPIPVSK
jgi:Holliday junction resolvasome RuvABC endonuclease subunit